MANKEIVLHCNYCDVQQLDLDHYAANLADDIVEHALRTVRRQCTNTVVSSDTSVLIDIKDEDNLPGHLSGLVCSSEPRPIEDKLICLNNGTNDNQGDSQATKLRCFAQKLCCDIINGALHNLDNSTKAVIPAKPKLFSSHINDECEYRYVSTDRSELFYQCNIRPTKVISVSPKKRQSTNDSNFHTKAKRKKTRYKRKLDRELAKLKLVYSKVS